MSRFNYICVYAVLYTICCDLTMYVCVGSPFTNDTITCMDNLRGIWPSLLCPLQLHGRPGRSLYAHSCDALLFGDSDQDSGKANLYTNRM